MMAFAIGLTAQTEVTFDMSDLPAGLYFVNIVGGKVVTRKVVVE